MNQSKSHQNIPEALSEPPEQSALEKAKSLFSLKSKQSVDNTPSSTVSKKSGDSSTASSKARRSPFSLRKSKPNNVNKEPVKQSKPKPVEENQVRRRSAEQEQERRPNPTEVRGVPRYQSKTPPANRSSARVQSGLFGALKGRRYVIASLI